MDHIIDPKWRDIALEFLKVNSNVIMTNVVFEVFKQTFFVWLYLIKCSYKQKYKEKSRIVISALIHKSGLSRIGHRN